MIRIGAGTELHAHIASTHGLKSACLCKSLLTDSIVLFGHVSQCANTVR